jgi:hypothetical protein
MAREAKSILQVQEEMEMEDRNGKSTGTAKDAQEMDRLGKQQQLNVCLVMSSEDSGMATREHVTDVRSATSVSSPSLGSPARQ